MSILGVLDSGLGGYSVVKAIREKYPKQDIVFLADEKNSPYGLKSREEMMEIYRQNIEFFKKKGITRILIACNTLSSLGYSDPEAEIIPIIQLTANQVKEDRVLVLATCLCCSTHAYKKALGNREVYEIGLPHMTDLFENRACDKEKMLEISTYAADFKDSKIPVVLGCTHYPIVKDLVEQFTGGKTYDSRLPILDLNIYTEGTGHCEYYSSKDGRLLSRKVKDVFKDEIEGVTY